MATELVVAVTFGQRDLQLLAAASDNIYSVSPRQEDVRKFHDFLNQGSGYEFVWPGEVSGPLTEQFRFSWEDPQPSFLPSTAGGGDRLRPATWGDLGVTGRTDNVLLVFPKLLAEPLQRLSRELQDRTVILREFMVFYTCRAESSRWASGEPIAAERLCEWLSKQLTNQDALGNGESVTFRALDFLRDEEDLFIEDEAGNQHLLPAAANRIDDALRCAAKKTATAKIRLHDSGGIPAASPVLQASARLHFDGRVEYKAPPEGRGGKRAQSPVRLLPAVELLEARRRAIQLVRNGHFTAARVLAEGFLSRSANSTVAWANIVAAVAYYFEGRFIEAKTRGDTCDWRGALKHLRTLSYDSVPESLHTAFEAEAALRAGDVPKASFLTLTFFENAVFDAVSRKLSKTSGECCVDWKTGEVVVKKTILNPTAIKDLVNDVMTRPDLLVIPITPKGKMALSEIPGSMRIRPAVLTQRLFFVHAVGHENHGNCPDLAAALRKMGRALYYKKYPSQHTPAEFRNLLAHSFATEAQLRQAPELFCRRELWKRDPNVDSLCFLAGNNPSAVLKGLGIGHPEKKYNVLVDALVTDILETKLT
jgi:hypothetical protein